ncbi:hypothetical protein M0R45_016168 [Rubus argutus]|uniref:Ubiquitin-like protease family profile domain-containing protein n=1 Tax=Rubus argutus TaxID=59490 RepID=A0AAW1XS21_RUBAR
MSRKGYAGLEEELSSTLSDEEIDRATLLIKGRQTKQGNFKDEETEKAAKKIETLRKKVESGKLTISGSDDVLTLALGTPEHSGRVRGGEKILVEERDKIIEEAKDKIIAEERAFWMARLEHLEAKLDAREVGKVDVDIPHVSGHASCSQTANQTLDEGFKTLREKVRKPVSRAQQKNDVIKVAEKAKTNLEDMEDTAKPQYVQEQEHEEMEFVDLTVLGDKSKVPAAEIDCKLALGSIDQIVALATVLEWDDPSQTIHDVRRLARMREVTGNCIVLYQRYLYNVLTQCQLFMLPYNADSHWTLTIVDPDIETVYFLDPMKRRLGTREWIGIVDSAIAMYNVYKGRKGQSSVIWKNLNGIPPQPSDKECGYFVMRYMRDIIEDKDLSFVSKWERRGNHAYTQEDIDEVRNEWATFVVNTYV